MVVHLVKIALFGFALLLLPLLAMKVVARNTQIVESTSVGELPGAPIDAVIVPGARVMASGDPSGAFLDRILLAEALLETTQAEIVFASGGPGEPEVVARLLSDREVIIDTEGTSTIQTCRNAVEAGLDRVAIVTQPRHRGRTAAVCAALGLDPVVVTTPPARELKRRRPRRFVRERLSESWALVVIATEPFA